MEKRIASLDPLEVRVTRALVDVLPNYDWQQHDGSLICTGPNGSYIVDPIAELAAERAAQDRRAALVAADAEFDRIFGR